MPRAELVRHKIGLASLLMPPPATHRLGRLLTCKEATRLISQRLDGPLPIDQRLLLRLHLIWCLACRRFEQQGALLRKAMQRYRM